jgi:Spy/CpxP family protein refolding chaperone
MRRTTTRRTTILAATLTTLALGAAPGLAMQPPGEPAQEHFGCVDGENSAVGGHPGAAGLLHATPRVGAFRTAWNAVEHAEPIEFGSC